MFDHARSQAFSKTMLMALALLLAGAALLLGLRDDVAHAQVPPHVPGTVCYTPNFWCWANPPGPPGTPCVCQAPTGYYGGILG
jgi:hypothetical protein